jgi:hypothetical protein
MLRLFINLATRWATISVIALCVFGGAPAIAVACEGAGEETALEAEVEREEAVVDDMFIRNPFNRAVTITSTVEVFPAGRGRITNNGSCLRGNIIAALGKCTYEQERPTGGRIFVR